MPDGTPLKIVALPALPRRASLWDAIAPDYADAGGLDNAVQEAIDYRPQMAAQALALHYLDPVTGALMERYQTPTFTADSLRQPVPVGRLPSGDSNWGDSLADVGIRINPDTPDLLGTLQHELGHQQLYRINSPHNLRGVNSLDAYMAEPAEVDTRLGAIKRDYARDTGQLVTSPAEAGRALDWAVQHSTRPDVQDALPAWFPADRAVPASAALEDYRRRHGQPLMTPQDKARNLQILKWRMPGVVQDDSVLNAIMGQT
jgi:hypothetical protein